MERGPVTASFPPLLWGGKHRQTDKLEPPQLPSSSHPPACLLSQSDNSTASDINKRRLLLEQQPLHLNVTFFSQLFFPFTTETQQYLWNPLLSAPLVVDVADITSEASHTFENRRDSLNRTLAHIISAEIHKLLFLETTAGEYGQSTTWKKEKKLC